MRALARNAELAPSSIDARSVKGEPYPRRIAGSHEPTCTKKPALIKRRFKFFLALASDQVQDVWL